MHVMIAIDGTEVSSGAAEAAVAMFGTGNHYSIVSVGSPLPLQAVSPLGVEPALLMVAADEDEPVVDVTTQPERYVRETVDQLPVTDVETVVTVGAPGPAICELADERGVDVIVLGAHDRGWLSRLVAPSVARYVVEHAPCHVLVIRNQGSGPGGAGHLDAQTPHNGGGQ